MKHWHSLHVTNSPKYFHNLKWWKVLFLTSLGKKLLASVLLIALRRTTVSSQNIGKVCFLKWSCQEENLLIIKCLQEPLRSLCSHILMVFKSKWCRWNISVDKADIMFFFFLFSVYKGRKSSWEWQHRYWWRTNQTIQFDWNQCSLDWTSICSTTVSRS